MNVKVPLGLLLLLVAALGYIFGTEHGRRHRDLILVTVGRKPNEEEAGDPDPEDAAAPEHVEV
ncbi:MAG: hypothetical protein OEV40_28570 [Acidimicrobiia bacterium]|nr:hypothetical protein [Acidimicrobiia bacterium]